MAALLPGLLRSSLNIIVLLGALVVSPLLLLSHFNALLADMLGDFAGSFLPNPTLLQVERRSRLGVQAKMEQRRILAAGHRASDRAVAKTASSVAHATGGRILIRGAGALAIGWVPVLGTSADVISLAEDYADMCELFWVLDNLFVRLELESGRLYEENYCDVLEQGLAKIKHAADDTSFPWQWPDSP
jgi:hypothetical protein